MKSLKTTISTAVFAVCATFGVQAQLIQQQNLPEAKSAFVRNQNYLSPTARPTYNHAYNDSLRGFDESKVKQDLLNRGLQVSEALGHVETLKREYIINKYHLRPSAISGSSSGSGSSSTSSPGRPIGGGAYVNVAPCVNEDFEASSPGAYTSATAVTGWTIESSNTNGSSCNPSWSPGSGEFSLRATPIMQFPNAGTNIGIIQNSPLGGTVVAQLNDDVNDYYATRIRQTFPVTQQNSLFQFAYAGYWQDGGSGHYCCPVSNDQPGIKVALYSCSNTPLACASLSLFPGSGCQSTGTTYTVTSVASWSNWQIKFIDLTPFIGSCITVEFVTQDCAFGGHYGTTLLDCKCGGQFANGLPISTGTAVSIAGPVSFCAGSNQAIITAPFGYASYQWIAPGIGTVAAPAGTMSTYTVNNPVPGSVYTVQLTSASGCQYVSTNTIVFSQVNIAGIGSTSTCPNGSSGSATVVGNGSGTGYNYTWLNSTNSVVGTSSLVTGLAPGQYTVILTGMGSAGCGSAVASVTVPISPPVVNNVIKPYCGNQAFLMTQGGINYQWYGPSGIISGTQGALPSQTITNPSNGQVWVVTYTTTQGCKDSTRFTLGQTTPGLMTVPPAQIKLICPGASNGTAVVSMVPANGAVPGFNTFSVAATGTTPAYNATLGPTSQNNFTLTGLSPGGYTVVTFDGSCKYNTTFNVPQLNWNYNVGLNNVSGNLTASVCPGQTMPMGVYFGSPPSSTQYSYSWTPTTWMPGNNGSFQSTLLSPTIPVGSNVTIVYTVAVTPSVAPCTITKTLAVTAISPPVPTINPIPNMCKTFAPYQIQAVPGGGTFVNSTAGLVNPSSGVITPTLGLLGNNTVTYNILVWNCANTQTATFEVSNFQTAALTSTIPNLCVTNPAFNLNNIVQSTSGGTWIPNPNQPGTPPGAITIGSGGVFFFNPGGLPTASYPITYTTSSSPNPTVCPDVSNINVNVTATLVPSISAVNPFCNIGAPFSLQVSPQGGTWSGPNVTSGGVITPSLIANAGVYTANYSVQVGPCVNFGSISYQVAKFNSAAVTQTNLAQLCYNSNPANLMSVAVSTVNGVWTMLSHPQYASAVTNNSFNPQFGGGLPTDTYTLQYTTAATGPNLCPDSRVITVSVLNPPMPSIFQVGPYCSKSAPVQMTVTPATGQWVQSSFLSSTGVFTPTDAAIGSNAVQYIIGTSTCNRQNTKFINVEAFVPAAISGHIPDLCNTSPAINLSPFASSGSGGWTGPGVTGTNFNPAVAGQGNWVLLHSTASSPSGLCPDQATVAVTVFSLQAPVIDPVPQMCNTKAPFKLNPSPVGGLFGGINTIAIDNAGIFSPASAQIGDNIINYSITSGPCVAYAQTTVNVVRFVSAALSGQPKDFCPDDDPQNMNQYAMNPGGEWTGSGILPGDFNFNPKYAMVGMNEIVYRTRSTPNPTLCPDENKITVEVINVPHIAPIAYPDRGCAPFEVMLNIPNTTIGEAEWVVSDGSEPQKSNPATGLSHVFTTPGKYTILVNYVIRGCKVQASVSHPIIADATPEPNFTYPDEILISSPEVQLTNLTPAIGDNKYTWKITGMEDIKNEVHPKVPFPKIGKYSVTLVAERTESSCKNEVTKVLEVKNDFNIFIPTSFSPNFDGLNDEFKPVFTPYGLDLKSFEMEIFDRWGHTLYRTRDINKGWDGSINNKGEQLKEEVYVYRIKYRDLDGNSYSKMGHVSLVK
jgi:gliding motility-associated-like protein